MKTIESYRASASNWVPFAEASTYDRRMPNLFNFYVEDNQLRNWLLTKICSPQVNTPEQDIYFFKNAYATDITLLFDKDKVIIPFSGIDHVSNMSFDDFDALASSNIQYIDECVAFIMKAGKDNYGHFITEMLPKLEVLNSISESKIKILIPVVPNSLYMIMLNINNDIYNNKFEFINMTSPIVKVKELIVPGPITKHNSQKSEVVKVFFDKIVDKYNKKQNISANRKIYVSRSKFNNRKMTNEEQVENVFQSFGFDIIHPQLLSFKDQIELFSNANEIAGPMGAGLTNICFSPKNSNIIMIDNGMCDLFFYDLACLMEQNFSWIFSRKISQSNATDLHSDWILDKSTLVEALKIIYG